MKKTILIIVLILCIQPVLSQWVQQGSDLDGEAAGDNSGRTISLSSDGNRIAIGASRNDGDTGNPADERGHTRVYEFDGVNWNQLGQDIDGESPVDWSGWSVSLNADGSRVAIGAYRNDGNSGIITDDRGHVRVYEFDGVNWNQLGNDMDGEAPDDRLGTSVSLNGDGTIVAAGARNNDGNGNVSGHVRIYQFDGVNWNQLGQDIDGESASDFSGGAISLNTDGSIVAIGAHENDGSAFNSGHVRVYEFDGINWNQLGSDIDGEAASDYAGTAVSLSSDGSIVAVAAPANDGNGANSGHVRIYQFDGINWNQLGSDIDGEAPGDWSGASISLSSDGSIIAIGAIQNDGNGPNSGQTRIYEFDGVSWNQINGDIDGEAQGDEFGRAVSLNSDGSRVAIGSYWNDANTGNFNDDRGHVRIYENFSLLYTIIPDPNFEQALIDQGIDSDGILDGQVLTSDISEITDLNIANLGITDLTGIEAFTALVNLFCDSNLLTSLEVSNNTSLRRLHCQNNQLSGSIDLRGLNMLLVFNALNNPGLSCIQVDDFMAADSGTGIYYYWIKDDTALYYSENCMTDPYTFIPDANFEQALIDRNIDTQGVLDGQVLTSDISGVIFLIIPGENIADLSGIEAFVSLQQLICSNNLLTGSLVLNTNTDLTYLDCSNNQLTSINVNNADNLTEFYCNNNQITGTLNLIGSLSLEEFNVTNNPLLNCIEVTDAAAATAGTGIYSNRIKDITANYSENCAGMMVKQTIASNIKNGENNTGEKREISMRNALKLYPNPVRDRLHIVVPAGERIERIDIYNIQGKKLLETQSNSIDVKNLPEGLYFVKIQTDKMEYDRKIIISGK